MSWIDGLVGVLAYVHKYYTDTVHWRLYGNIYANLTIYMAYSEEYIQ